MQARQLTAALRRVSSRAPGAPVASLLRNPHHTSLFVSKRLPVTRPGPYFALRDSPSNLVAATNPNADYPFAAAASGPNLGDDYYKLVPVEELLSGAARTFPAQKPPSDSAAAHPLAVPAPHSPTPTQGIALSSAPARTSTTEPAAFATVTVLSSAPPSVSFPEPIPMSASDAASAPASVRAPASTSAVAPPSTPIPPPALSAAAAAAAAAAVAATSPKLNVDGWPVRADTGAPLEPEPWQCCGNDCVNCVWIQYEEQVNKFKDMKKAEAAQSKAGSAGGAA